MLTKNIILLLYLTVINIITVSMFAFDKSRSSTAKRRIPERTLLILALVGGTPGALFSMNTFRHKTKKLSFQLPLYLIVLLQIALIVWILHRLSII